MDRLIRTCNTEIDQYYLFTTFMSSSTPPKKQTVYPQRPSISALISRWEKSISTRSVSHHPSPELLSENIRRKTSVQPYLSRATMPNIRSFFPGTSNAGSSTKKSPPQTTNSPSLEPLNGVMDEGGSLSGSLGKQNFSLPKRFAPMSSRTTVAERSSRPGSAGRRRPAGADSNRIGTVTRVQLRSSRELSAGRAFDSPDGPHTSVAKSRPAGFGARSKLTPSRSPKFTAVDEQIRSDLSRIGAGLAAMEEAVLSGSKNFSDALSEEGSEGVKRKEEGSEGVKRKLSVPTSSGRRKEIEMDLGIGLGLEEELAVDLGGLGTTVAENVTDENSEVENFVLNKLRMTNPFEC